MHCQTLTCVYVLCDERLQVSQQKETGGGGHEYSSTVGRHGQENPWVFQPASLHETGSFRFRCRHFKKITWRRVIEEDNQCQPLPPTFMCTMHVHTHRKKCFPIGTVVPPSMPDNTFLYLFVSYSYYHHNSIKQTLSPSLMYSWKKQVLRSLTEVIYLLSRDEIKTRIPRPHFHVLLPYCLRDACTQKAVWRVQGRVRLYLRTASRF